MRVLLIGLDSADAELIEGWMEEGVMPHFDRLRRDGMWTRVGTTAEIMHVSAWPTIYTGTTPGHHGLYHAYQVAAGRQTIGRAVPSRSPVPPFWKNLDEAGRRAIVMDAFMDYRLEGFRGIQILEYGTWTWFGEPGSTPRGMLKEIQRRYGPYPAPEHTDQVRVPDQPRRFLDQLVAGTEVKARIVRDLMREQSWDMLFVTFGEPHGAGHYLWHFGDEDYPIHMVHPSFEGSHPMREVYAAIDRAVGAIVEASDDDTTVIVTSGDGMGPNYSGCHMMPELLHRMDLFHSESVGRSRSDGPPPKKKGLLSAMRQAIPIEWRQAVSRCLPRSARYRLSLKWMNSGIDWSRSRAFCIPNSNEGYFRVNLRGREPMGLVEPGAEYDEVLGRIREQLEGLTNPRNGVRAAERITLVDDVFCGVRREDLPDASISWEASARIAGELDTPELGHIDVGSAGYEISPFYTGNHRPNAFVLARGPGVSAGAKPEGGAHILDIAPSVLALLGVDAPPHFEGRALPELIP